MDALSLCKIIAVFCVVNILEVEISLRVKGGPLCVLYNDICKFQLLPVQSVRLRLAVDGLIVHAVCRVIYKCALCIWKYL